MPKIPMHTVNIPEQIKMRGGSTAAGAYQFLERFYKEEDFSPQSQDKAAVSTMTSSSYEAAKSGNMETFKTTTEERWTSLKDWTALQLQKFLRNT